ncbi:MAG: hypothetical protein AAF721_34885 [Myxococcota bacterium]
MSSIDAVIARSRMAGGFSERKRFTVARREGIEKMRKFALADPHHYVLELAQSAIANHAEYIDLQVEKESATLSYIGGGLREAELAQLFDFLFASKDRADIGHVRELALGLNAALLFKPERIVVESGDGTLAGSTRMVLHGAHDEVEVGRPERPMSGTFISVQEMNRSALDGRWFSGFNEDWPREYQVIEERCLAAPIPIVVGGRPLFGWASQRTPGLFGYKKVLSFDEGELYGTLGLKPTFGHPEFRLLTWGVAIQSRSQVLLDGQQIGGIVCFDRLHKTVDHSGIVEDERLAEMWERLKPYARQLVSGKKQVSPYGATAFGQTEPLTPVQLRALVRGCPIVVAVPPGTAPSSPEGQRAHAIGHALQAPVLCVVSEQVRVLPVLAGGELGIVLPDLSSDHDRAFYGSDPATPPARPWLASPIEVEPLSTRKLAASMLGTTADAARGGHTQRFADALGPGEVQATVYTPAALTHAGSLTVEVLSTDRLIWRGQVPSSHSGYVVVVQLPHTPPRVLRAPIDDAPGAPTVVEEVARVVAEHAAPALSTAFERAVADLERNPDCKPGTRAASLGLAAAARSAVARLAQGEGQPAFELVSLGTSPAKALDLPLLASVDGRPTSLRSVAASATEGLVYGSIPEVPADLEGLDRSRVLTLSAADERLVIELIGTAAYARVDARDLLASYEGVLVRDIAIGLRDYPDFPMLVEGEDPTTWPLEARKACLDTLLAELILRFLGVEPARPEAAQAYPAWEENRRQACRHLQYAVVQLDGDAPDELANLPLFRNAEGKAYSWSAVRPGLAAGDLPLLYGQGLGHHELGQLASAALNPDAPVGSDAPDLLVTSPFVHRLLQPFGVRPAFDTTAPESAAEPSRPLLSAIDVARGEIRGHVGIPTEAAETEIVVVLPNGRRTRTLELARKYGMVGLVRVAGSRWSQQIYQRLLGALDVAGTAALRALLDRVRATLPTHAHYNRMLAVLLEYAGRNLSLTARPDGGIQSTVKSDLSTEILGLPVFGSRFGGPVPAWRLVRRFAAVAAIEADPTAAVLSDLDDDLPAELRAWIAAHLRPGKIARPSTRRTRTPAPTPQWTAPKRLKHTVFAERVETWLERLRPDHGERVAVEVQYRGPKENWIFGGVNSISLNADHWLVRWGLEAPGRDAAPLAWLLLATYAYMNEVREPLTNKHERAFQVRVSEVLASGELAAPLPVG